jgi:hypothetical protein
MVAVDNRAAPKFKQRVADYFLKRGIYTDGNEEGMIIPGGRKKRSPGGGKVFKPRIKHQEEKEVVVAEETGEEKVVLQGPQEKEGFMDMAMGIIALTPMETNTPKDMSITRIKYATADCCLTPLSEQLLCSD